MDKKFHSGNRRRLSEHMIDNEVMLFFSGESVRKSADEDFPFFSIVLKDEFHNHQSSLCRCLDTFLASLLEQQLRETLPL